MYVDNSPIPNFPPSDCKVIVLEETDKNADAIIEVARDYGAVSTDADGDEIFWIVFEKNPQRVWDFTEKALRQSIK